MQQLAWGLLASISATSQAQVAAGAAHRRLSSGQVSRCPATCSMLIKRTEKQTEERNGTRVSTQTHAGCAGTAASNQMGMWMQGRAHAGPEGMRRADTMVVHQMAVPTVCNRVMYGARPHWALSRPASPPAGRPGGWPAGRLRFCSAQRSVLQALGAAVGDPGQQLLGGDGQQDVPQLRLGKAGPAADLGRRGEQSGQRFARRDAEGLLRRAAAQPLLPRGAPARPPPA